MRSSIVFFITAFFAATHLFAQSNGGKTIDEIFAENRKGRETVILKTNPTTMLSGDFPLYAELRLARRFSLEAGAGIMAGYFIREFPYIAFGKKPFEIKPERELDVTGGYSLRVFPKFFFIGDNLEGAAIGPFWRTRQYGIQNSGEKVRFTDLCLMFSQQAAIGRSQIFVEYYIGFGVRTPHFPSGVMPVNDDRHLIAPWGLKVGYGF